MAVIAVGDAVQTPLGKGVVREVRRNGRLLVDIGGRGVVVEDQSVKTIDRPAESSRKKRPSRLPSADPDEDRRDRRGGPEVDLHGLIVADALDRAERAINDALLAGHAQLRIIHGRSGGRIRAALHRQLRQFPSVRAFRLDPDNEGVTIIQF